MALGRNVAALGAVAVVVALLASGTTIAAPGTAGGPPSNSCVITLAPCYIVLSTASGSHGNSERVNGTGFWPGDQVTVYFWNGVAGSTAQLVATGSTGVGSFSVTFRIPNDPVGNYVVFATDLTGDNQSAAFHLTHLRASPDLGAPGSTTVVNGEGFLPDHVVTFRIEGAKATASPRCRTNASGDFSSCTLTIPSVAPGTTLLKATDGTYTARIRFTVS